MKRFLFACFTVLSILITNGTGYASAAPTQPPAKDAGKGVAGVITSVDGTTITVKSPAGSATIATTSSTTFMLNNKSASLSNIVAGLMVRAEGTVTNKTFTATKVMAESAPQGNKPPQGKPAKPVIGQVSAVDGTTITVKTRDGSATIATTSSTTFKLNDKSATLSDITVGLYLAAEGTQTDKTFTATKVIASTKLPAPPAKK